jgi:hypothetical protein
MYGADGQFFVAVDVDADKLQNESRVIGRSGYYPHPGFPHRAEACA